MKKWKITLMLFCCFVLIITPIKAREAFVINSAHIEMNVHEDGSIDIVETYQLDFSDYRHGFYRNIPTSYQQTWDMDGTPKQKSYYFPVSAVSCNTTCSLEQNYDGIQIKLGDADDTVIGEQSYQISYHVQTKDLDLNGIQMLYWNLIGDFDTTIKSFSYRIQMPKAFDAQQVYTYTGKYGAYGTNLTYEVDGNIISGKIKTSMMSNENATIMVHLPNDYFQFPVPKNYDGWTLGMMLVLLLICGVLFMRFGKDDDIITTVEFTAPDGLDSAGVGYVIDQFADNKDILSLLLIWANGGYIKIYDQKDGFQLEKIKSLPVDAKEYEKEFFYALFSKKDLVDKEDLMNQQVSNALNRSKHKLSSYFRVKERRVSIGASTAIQVLMLGMLVLPQMMLSIACGYAKYETMFLVIPFLIPIPLLMISSIPWIFIMRKHHAMKQSTFYLSAILTLIFNGIFLMANAAIQWFFNASWYMILLALLISIVLMIMMMFMDKRSKQGNVWLGQILGLKEFILSCEKDRIELLVKDDPYAFFDILPYAYVLGVSDTWVKKFEDIAIPYPSWYEGYDDGRVFTSMLWWSHFHYCFHDISKAATYVPQPKGGSGGGSFGSGGFGGGGGFSGGGFGGGGGGSW